MTCPAPYTVKRFLQDVRWRSCPSVELKDFANGGRDIGLQLGVTSAKSRQKSRPLVAKIVHFARSRRPVHAPWRDPQLLLIYQPRLMFRPSLMCCIQRPYQARRIAINVRTSLCLLNATKCQLTKDDQLGYGPQRLS